MENCCARVPVGILENPPQRLQVVRPIVGSDNEWDAAVLVGLVVMSILTEFLSFGLFLYFSIETRKAYCLISPWLCISTNLSNLPAVETAFYISLSKLSQTPLPTPSNS